MSLAVKFARDCYKFPCLQPNTIIFFPLKPFSHASMQINSLDSDIKKWPNVFRKSEGQGSKV